MLVLTIRSDKPEAELGLYQDQQQLAYEHWTAHRQLGATIHSKIAGLLQSAGKDWADIGGIIAFRGPGSFTGLRIGLTVANSLAYGRDCPIVGSDGEEWISDGLARLSEHEDDRVVMPEYGAEVHITQQKK
jgi:tRNA threonylcarbamoyladenosine biosynthesis protein TsaB